MAVARSTTKALHKRQHKVPTAIPIILLASTTLVVFIAPLQLLLAILTAELIYLATSVGSVKKLLQTTILPMTIFIAPLFLLSATIQVVVGGIDVSILLLSSVRMALLYLTAALFTRMLSMAKLVRDLSKLSPTMALSIAIGIRMLTIGLYILNEVKHVYSTNMATKCSSFKCRVEYVTVLAKAITRIFIHTVLDIGESIYSRYGNIWVKQQFHNRRQSNTCAKQYNQQSASLWKNSPW